jgi:hypothetical protein
MSALYPQFVDASKPTIGGLRFFGGSVSRHGMAKDPPQYPEIGARLATIRRGFSELSQSGWAEKNGFNPTQYNNWEKGVRRIPVDEAERLCAGYGLTLDFIYRGRRDGLSDSALKRL